MVVRDTWLRSTGHTKLDHSHGHIRGVYADPRRLLWLTICNFLLGFGSAFRHFQLCGFVVPHVHADVLSGRFGSTSSFRTAPDDHTVQSWAVAIGATVLQTQLDQRLPADFVAMLPSSGGDIAYKAIPLIRQLPLPLQLEVRRAFADALRVLWWIMLGFAGAGWLLVLLMRELPLHTQRDERWGLEERASKENVLVSDDIKQDAQSALPEATSAIELEVL
jgi:hypothetical protein